MVFFLKRGERDREIERGRERGGIKYFEIFLYLFIDFLGYVGGCF